VSLTQAILDEMSERGVTARVDGETLRLKPRAALDDDLLARIKEHKLEIIRALVAIPPMPEGVRLIRWEPKPAPVAIDVCSVVVDVRKFIHGELRALDSRLNNPWTIHGGYTVPQMLDRLAQAGLEVELDPKGGAND
jgi:hypothetical protein